MRDTKKKGFTLIELLIVVAIIGLLATIVIIAVAGARKKANATQAKSFATEITKAFEMYKAVGCSGATTITVPTVGSPLTACAGAGSEVLIQRFPPITSLGGGLSLTILPATGTTLTYNNYLITVSGFADASSFACSNGSCSCSSTAQTGCTQSN